MEEMKVVPVPWYRRKAWILRNFGTPGFLIGAPFAYVLGILTMLPTGWELGENATTVIAAAVTSLAAVGGAIAVWHYQQDQESKATGAYVVHALSMPVEDLYECLRRARMVQKKPTLENWEHLDAALIELNSLMSRVGSASLQDEKLLLKLDPRAMEMIVFWLQKVLRGVNGDAHRIRQLIAQVKHNPQKVREPEQLFAEFEFWVKQYVHFRNELKTVI